MYCGDDAGMVTLTDVSAFTKYFKTGDGKDVFKKKVDAVMVTSVTTGSTGGSSSSTNNNNNKKAMVVVKATATASDNNKSLSFSSLNQFSARSL